MPLLKQLIRKTLPTSSPPQHFQFHSNNPIKLHKHNNVFSSSILDQSSLFNLPITPQAKAFHSFSLQRESSPPSPSLALSLFYTAFNLIKSTTSKPTFITVSSLHCLALKVGASVDVHILTSLLNLYSKAGDFDSSWNLFEEIPERDVISWNAMITTCFRDQRFEFVLDLFKEMLKEGSGFDSTTLLIVLSALSRMNDFRQGQSLHGLSLKKGMLDFDSESFLCNSLIDMYAKCGEWRSSELVFEDMGSSNRDPTTWNSIMSGFLHNGLAGKSLWYFRRMVVSGVPADNVSLSCTISACSSLGELHFGQAIHGLGIKLGYGENTIHTAVLNALISFYSQCGEVEAAEKLFSGIVIHKDVVSWNSMIHGSAVSGMTFKAFDLLSEMQLEWAIQPESATLISVLPLCAELKLLREGRAVHGFIVRKGMDFDLLVVNSLLDVYAKCRQIKSMELLFETMSLRDLVSWNTMIAGYSLSERSREAQTFFQETLHLGHRCSLSTLLAILPSCNSPKKLHFGKLIHGLQHKMGFSNKLLAVNALMCMYINCGDVLVSFSLLQSIAAIADVVSWNTVIVGCAQSDHFLEAVEAFEKMRWQPNITPDSITIVNVLSACGNLEEVSKGRLLHGITIKTKVGLDIRVSNALITMYSRCKDIESAGSVFISTGQCRNLCSWNCMISGFAQNKDGKRALELFNHLEFEPNEFTLVSILSASNQLGDLTHGKQIHGYICRFGFQQNPFILAALVDMYSKCGRLDTAIQIFEDSPEKMKSVAAWNSMISAYGYHGHGTKAIKLFHKMCESGENGATKSTFVSLLSACNHSGMIEEGYSYYGRMLEEFGVRPDIEHHVCMVDMLGRAGRIREAYEFTKGLPDHQRLSATGGGGVWGALLSACQYHGDLKMGEEVAEHLFSLEPENVGYYVSLCNIYTAAGRWSDAMNIRRKILDRRLKKPPGCSFISWPFFFHRSTAKLHLE